MNIDEIQNSTILIVDDNPTNLGTLFYSLIDYGFKVLLAQDGETALQQIMEKKPDIIMLDIIMPGIDGFETLRRIKSNEQLEDIPVIFMSALNETVDKVKGFKFGAVDYITKPIQHEEVIARISAHLTIQKQQKILTELNDTKDQFFSIISHDLRSPFASFVNITNHLNTEANNGNLDHIREIAKELHLFSKRIYSLIDNLLEWSRIQRNVIEFSPDNLNLLALINETIKIFKKNIEDKSISIIIEVPEDLMISADKHMLETVLRNLISNAIKFTHQNGEIILQGEMANNHAVVRITDNGIGVNKDNLPKMFQINTRYKTEGTMGEKGTGLGLVLCKEFIEKHGGTIEAESEPGQGTAVTITLPL